MVEIWCGRHIEPLEGDPQLEAVPYVKGSWNVNLDALSCPKSSDEDDCRDTWRVWLQ